jgi:hypothetical protein
MGKFGATLFVFIMLITVALALYACHQAYFA